MNSSTKWQSYEEVAVYLLNQFAEGLETVEDKQTVIGLRSGTNWEIDAKGFCQNGSGFIIVECLRYTTSKQTQEKVGALAYRISDTGATGGIIVSPHGLQEGAERVAKAENILSVQLNPESSRSEYVLQFLNRVMVGFHESITITESLEIVAKDREGNIIHRMNR